MIDPSYQSIWREAEQFIRICYHELERSDEETELRLAQIYTELVSSGTYSHTEDELTHGARMAWRNSARCIGRLFWPSLEVIDKRKAESEEEVTEALLQHIDLATNGGRIRPVITIFAQQDKDTPPVRIWNHQLIRYAGYKTEAGVIGDPASAAFTKECLNLGWKGEGTPFDVLPLVVQIGGQRPKWHAIPSSSIMEIPLVHPEDASFAELGLRWYAVPMIADMKLEIGGLTYPAAPFNGWYMETEIGARNLADRDRYNKLEEVALKLGLDVSTNISLWKDRALVELNRAVLHSFKLKGVSIVDHHTASDQFIRFEKQEREAEREVSGRWSWLIPPMSPAATQIWHNAYTDLEMRPSLEYQKAPFEGKNQTEGEGQGSEPQLSKTKPSDRTVSTRELSTSSAERCPFH